MSDCACAAAFKLPQFFKISSIVIPSNSHSASLHMPQALWPCLLAFAAVLSHLDKHTVYRLTAWLTHTILTSNGDIVAVLSF